MCLKIIRWVCVEVGRDDIYFDIVVDNCEYFVNWCVMGEYYSY